MFGLKPGHRIIELEDTDSTNSYAARLLHDEIPEEGTVIITRFQKAGRGQRGNNWESEANNNLLLSYIFYPNFLAASDQFYLNQAFALAVRETIQKFTSRSVYIKWPNDIIVSDQKIAGILIENSVRNGKIIHSIAGTGINVNQTSFRDYAIPPTSLAMLENKSFKLPSILNVLNSELEKWYAQVRLSNFTKIKEAYLSHLYRYNTMAKYESSGIRFNGTITGINNDGRLEISKEDGTEFLFANKEIKFLI